MYHFLSKKVRVGVLGCSIFVFGILLACSALGFHWNGSKIQLITVQPRLFTAPGPVEHLRSKTLELIDKVAAAQLPVLDRPLGNCTDATVYQLGSARLVVDNNACYERGVYIEGKP
jgi:hypothetical protein